jgi:transcription elongation factor GreA
MENIKYLTKEKFTELSKELEQLKTVKRKEIAQNLEYARSLGDLSENAEYQEAREMQANIENRIAIIEDTLKTAQIVGDRHTDSIGMGSAVKVQKAGGVDQSFKIVGSEEVNAHNGKISNQSPLGLALIGKRKGDEVKVSTPKGPVSYRILSVE